MTIAIVVLVGLVLIGALAFIGIRNSIIAERNRCDEAWSGIDVQLKRRHDLVPNLIEAVRGYASHEREVFERTAEARADAMRATGIGQAAEAEQQLTGALADLRAVAEGYPQLRATENFRGLSSALSQIEDEIQSVRNLYNADAQAYNTKIQVFPNTIVAKQGGFQPREYFQIEAAGERDPAVVSFDGRGQ